MTVFVESGRRSLVLVVALALLVSAVWVASSRDDAAAASATPVVYIVTGENFPDALGVGPASATQRGPILMVTRDSIPGPTSRELSRLRPDRIVVVGGTAVIASSVESQLRNWAPVTRIAGANRYATAALVSQAAFPAPPVGSGPIAAGAFGSFADVDSVPIPLSDQVKTELGSIQVTIPADGGVLSLTSQVSLENPVGAVGSFVLLWQTLDASCPSFVGATSVGVSDIANSDTEIVSQTVSGAVTAGIYTVRLCAQSSPIVAFDEVDVTEARITALWTPSTMGGAAMVTEPFGTKGGLSAIASRTTDRIALLRAAASEQAGG